VIKIIIIFYLVFFTGLLFSKNNISENHKAIKNIQEIKMKIKSKTNKKKPLMDFVLASAFTTHYGNSSYTKDGKDGSYSASEHKLSLAVPIPIQKNKLFILNGFDFTNLKANNNSPNKISTTDRNFYSFSYNLGIIKVVKKQWTIFANIKPTLSSDFKEDISSEDFIFQSSIFASKISKKNYTYGFGLSYTTRFGRPLLIPILTYIYRTGNWNTKIILPAYISQQYHFKNSKLGFSINLNGNNFNFKNDVSPKLDLDKLSYVRINIGPEYELNIYKMLNLNIHAGITVYNKISSADKKSNEELNLSSNNKFFFRLGLKIIP